VQSVEESPEGVRERLDCRQGAEQRAVVTRAGIDCGTDTSKEWSPSVARLDDLGNELGHLLQVPIQRNGLTF
jgi:hypothetical protein